MVPTLTLSVLLAVGAPAPATKIELTDKEKAALEALEKVGFELQKWPKDSPNLVRFPEGTELTYRRPPDEAAKLTGEDLAPLANLRRLRSLNLRSLPVTDKTMAAIQGMADLEVLDMDSEFVTDTGIKKLANCKKLVDFNFYRAPAVTDDGLAALAEHPTLTSFSLQYSKITDAGLVALEENGRLTHLSLGYSDGITDAGMTSLSKMPNLGGLGLFGSKNITDKGLASLSKLPNLRWLGLAESKNITDKGLALLCKPGACPKLVSLGLTETTITSEGLKALHDPAALPALKRLELSKKSVSEEAVEQLKKARPGLIVFLY
jgi:hypothetical protein